MSTVAVSVPTYRCTPYLGAAVRSVLAQSHEDVQVYVVSDGEGGEPWSALADVSDPRLHRFELSRRMGPYFIHDIVSRSGVGEYLLIQDADDTSEPLRVEVLLNELEVRPALAGVTSGQFYAGWYQSYAGTFCAPLSVEAYFDRVRHHGMYRNRQLLEFGGYYGGDRIAYDSFMTNVLYLANALGYVDAPLYRRSRRPDSLARDPQTGVGSPRREQVLADLTERWRQLFDASKAGATGAELRARSAELVGSLVTEDDRRAREVAVAELRAASEECGPVRIELPISGGSDAGETRG